MCFKSCGQIIFITARKQDLIKYYCFWVLIRTIYERLNQCLLDFIGTIGGVGTNTFSPQRVLNLGTVTLVSTGSGLVYLRFNVKFDC